MPVTTINGHVLIPHYPVWERGIRRSKLWQTVVDRGLNGSETRVALRVQARERMSFEVESSTPDDQTLLMASVAAALASGLAAVPRWGTGIQVASVTGADVTLQRNAWSWLQAGEYVFLAAPERVSDGEWFVGEVAAVDGTGLTLTADPGITDVTGMWVWPLMFGRPAFGDMRHRTDYHVTVSVMITELTPAEIPAPVIASTISFTYWLAGVPLADPPARITFDNWLKGAPLNA